MTNGFVRGFKVVALIATLSTISSVDALADKVSDQAERPLIQFHLDNTSPKVGQPNTLFLQLDSTFFKQEVLVDLSLDGVRRDEIVQTAPSLWVASLPVFTEIGSHLIEAKVSVRDEKESKRIIAALADLEKDLQKLARQIENEADPVRKAALEAEAARKLRYKEELETALAGLKVYLKSEFFSFSIAEDPENQDYPLIAGVSPELGSLSGGTRIVISGLRFGANPIVKIGGISASVISSSTTAIEVVAPAFSQAGAKDIEVQFPSDLKNAILKSGYFSTAQTTVANLKPVAVTNGYQAVSGTGATVQLAGSQSYDENLHSLTFAWKVLDAPKNTGLTPGATFSTLADPTFVGSKKGVYVFELRVRESATPEQLLSLPAIATIEVGK